MAGNNTLFPTAMIGAVAINFVPIESTGFTKGKEDMAKINFLGAMKAINSKTIKIFKG